MKLNIHVTVVTVDIDTTNTKKTVFSWKKLLDDNQSNQETINKWNMWTKQDKHCILNNFIWLKFRSVVILKNYGEMCDLWSGEQKQTQLFFKFSNNHIIFIFFTGKNQKTLEFVYRHLFLILIKKFSKLKKFQTLILTRPPFTTKQHYLSNYI